MVTALADHPEEVRLETRPRGRGIRIFVSVAQDDVGKVLGKRGRNAAAIRTLAQAAGAKQGVHVSVEEQELIGNHFENQTSKNDLRIPNESGCRQPPQRESTPKDHIEEEQGNSPVIFFID